MNQQESKYSLTIKPYMVWGLLMLLYFAVGVQNSVTKGFYFSVLFTSIQFVIYTLNRKIFVPRYFDTNKILFYSINIFGLLAFTFLTTTADMWIIHHLIEVSSNASFAFPFFLHTVLCFAATWISIAQHLMEKEKMNKIEIEELKREKAESELRFLKMQINPHFLFNAMNNIYTMAYTGDQSTAEKIAMLSDMLRYVLYDCESNFISLGKEIEYINSYIEFQQMKTEKQQNIELKIDIENEDYLIAPMLLIPFIENAFKHSKIEKEKNGFVKIVLKQTSNGFSFFVSNSYPEKTSSPKVLKGKGIGIDNVKSRLELLYPEAYLLDANKTDGEFTTHLELYRK